MVYLVSVSLTVLILTRPSLAQALPARSTDLALALEALKRGYAVYTAQPCDVFYNDGALQVHAQPLSLAPNADTARWHALQHDDVETPLSALINLHAATEVPVSNFHMVLTRQDPPQDFEYITNLQLLANALPPHVQVVPPPASILTASEKVAILHPLFQEFIAPTMVSADAARLQNFYQMHQRNIVLKPLYDAAGRGVVRIEPTHNAADAIQQALAQVSAGEPLMAQQFLSGVQHGDKRVFFIDGKTVGAIRRIPPEGSFKVALATGGIAAPAQLTTADHAICAQVETWLRLHKVAFAGIDIITDDAGNPKLIEINHTSPTGILAYERFSGINLAPQIWNALERCGCDVL